MSKYIDCTVFEVSLCRSILRTPKEELVCVRSCVVVIVVTVNPDVAVALQPECVTDEYAFAG